MKLAIRAALASATLALSACGSAGQTASDEADMTADARLNVRGQLSPQSFLHDSVTDAQPQVSYSFAAQAGDVIAPDVWPTASAAQGVNGLQPVLTLLGPSHNGKRPVLATGTPRGENDRHLAIDGFRIPKTGTYLVSVAQAAKGAGGQLTLRFWTSASHAPRPEAAQLSLPLQTSEEMKSLLDAQASQSWTDANVDAGIAWLGAQLDALTAFSDAEQLVVAVSGARSDGRATAAQLARVQSAAAALVGTPAQFASLTAQEQSFALYWLGDLTRAAFQVQEVAPGASSAALRAVGSQIDALVRSWSGAREEPGARHLRALTLGGAVYGYVADWECTLDDSDGTPVFAWYSTDYFDRSGRWLGEQSAGASEPDDD
jgi:hypothetical protein